MRFSPLPILLATVFVSSSTEVATPIEKHSIAPADHVDITTSAYNLDEIDKSSTLIRRGTVDVVFRADPRSPVEIAKANGFKPKGGGKLIYNLWRHTNELYSATEPKKGGVMGWFGLGEEVDGFVSTTSDYGTARYSFGRYNGGYIYKIKASHNLIDVSKTLGRHYRHKSEYEFAAKDIPMDQVMGWYTFSLGGHPDGDFEANDDAFYKKNAPSLSSRKYNEKYNGQTDGGAQNSVAGFPENHEAWTESPWKEISPYKSKKAKNPREVLKE